MTTDNTEQATPNDEIITNTEINSVDTVGTVFLGIGFLILLLAYMRSQGRNRRLAAKLAKAEAKG